MKKLKVTQVRSAIKTTERQKATIKALGLGKIGKSVELSDDPRVLGQLRVVNHLIKVEEVA